MAVVREKIAHFWATYKKSKWTWGILGVIAIILLIVFVGGGSSEDNSLVTVKRTDVIDQVVLSGRTQSASAVNLGFAEQGRIAQVLVTEGQSVKQGQLLASLDISDLAAQLKDARADLTIAQANANTASVNLENVIREQDILVENAYIKLLSEGLAAVPESSTYNQITPPTISGTYTAGPEGEYRIKVYPSSASSGLSFSVRGIENGYTQEVTTASSVPLGTRGLFIQFEPETSYGGTEWIVSIPNTRSSEYTTNVNNFKAAIATYERVVADARASVNLNSTERSIMQARIDQAQAGVDALISQINKRRIVAPFDGIIANTNLKVGESVDSNTTTINLIASNDYEVVLKTPEISVGKLVMDQAVDIILDAYGNEVIFPGKIVSINPGETIIDGVPVYETRVIFTTPDARIRSGMTAIATITIDQKNQVLAVPVSAIGMDKTGSYVSLVGTDEKSEKRYVTTGLRGSDSMIEIKEGLQEGDQIFANPE